MLTYDPTRRQRDRRRTDLEGDEQMLWHRLLREVASIVVSQVIQSLLLAGLIMWMFTVPSRYT